MRRALFCLLTAVACSDGAAEQAKRESCERVAAAWSPDVLGAEVAPTVHAAPVETSSTAKLAVAVYHFNVQYVAGGLVGFPDGEIVEQYNLDEAETEDRIVTEGLEPVLDLFLAHPTFRADIELQAYMVEVIALRHPNVLAKMKMLASSGQIDFDSFHYSDQLYVAYPRRDLAVSLDLTEQIFARAGLPLGLSIFTQEGQFARGQVPIAAQRGYEVSVLPKNLFSYQFGEERSNADVLYQIPGTDPPHAVIIGGKGWRGVDQNGAEVELQWTFMDDGEVAFSEGRLNPYFGLDYVVDPEKIAEHIAQLEAMETAGYTHVTIAEAVRALKKRGVAFADLPPVLDGTWQPADTNNVFRWMGGGGLFRAFEADSDVLASIWRARTAVERLELETAGDPEAAFGVRAAWREALLAQVSDSTGWNPFINEIRYSFERAEAARSLAADVRVCRGLEPDRERTIACTPSSKTLAELGAEVIAPARRITARIESCASNFGELTRIAIDVPKLVEQEKLLDANDMESKEREVELRFRQTSRTFGLATAFTEGVQSIALDDYTFESMGIALPIGLIELSPKRWVIQDLHSGRVAALIARTGADEGWVRFMDFVVSRAASSTRLYYLADGLEADEARALAETINR